ncbi:hypothetical protein CRENBAI_005435 [Crenichthys baileyi]|uniref:C-type lectin domain-containing protein n=1 Tax=Crenichthys baileyi TaxID=28760 RepID=A0AAV9SF32_9TELE
MVLDASLYRTKSLLIQISVMKKHGLLLVIAGLLAVCDLQSDQTIQQFRYVGLMKNWNDAQTYCRERFSDLATIQNSANSTKARQAAGTSKFWIGLFNGTWKWSEDRTSSLFTRWSTYEPQGGNCVTLNKYGYWSTSDCEELHQVLCYNGEALRNVLVNQKMTWSDAQSYCRSKYTDLSSIRTYEENYAMTLLLPLSYYWPDVAWIGLYRSDWVWSDGSSASYRVWATQNSIEQANCVMADSSSGTWSRQPCSENYTFLCSTEVIPSVRKSVKIRLKAGSADLNDPVVQESILQQLKQRMEDQGVTEEVNLRWKVHPEGKVFHREDKTAPPSVCKTDTCDTT